MRLEVAMGILPQVQVSKLLAASPAWWSLARVPSASSWRRSVCATLAIAMRTQGCSTIFAAMHRRWRASQQVGQLQLRVGQLRLQEISEGDQRLRIIPVTLKPMGAVWSPGLLAHVRAPWSIFYMKTMNLTILNCYKTSVVDSYWGSGSGSKNLQKIRYQLTWFPAFQKGFCTFIGTIGFLTCYR